jgi:hypothetical protein
MLNIIAAILLAQAASSPVGMILQTEGKVTILRAGRASDARLADLLFAGDQVNGRATLLFCPSSEKITGQADTALQLSADGLRVVKGAAPSKSSARCLLPKTALGSESMERIGGMRTRGELDAPSLALYVGGPITSNRPTLEWAAVTDAKSYAVTLRAEDGTTVWEQQTTGPRTSYPFLKANLKAGSYEWEVKAQSGTKVLAQEKATIEVKPTPKSLATILTLGGRLQSRSDALLHAIELENDGYYSEAAAFYRQLRQAQPNDSRITQHLAWLYWNAGLRSAANEETQRLK